MRVGIVGAGQLGSYLCHAARRLGLQTTVLASTPQQPACQVADQVVLGAIADGEPTCGIANPVVAMGELAQRVDVITFERENVSVNALDMLHGLELTGLVKVAPSVEVLSLLQNKFEQKSWLQAQGFPVGKFVECRLPDDTAALQAQAQACFAELGRPFVLKTKTGGYDGLGVRKVDSAEQMADFAGHDCIAEALIPLQKELAVLVVRHPAGECITYPVFEMDFDSRGNVLRRVVCPAGISEVQAQRARLLSKELISRLGGVGVFAVEMFTTGDDLLINEISPRVHNVGHLTLEAFHSSQFEQHMAAAAGLPLRVIHQLKPAVMENLLCEESLANAELERQVHTLNDDVHVHWYGKRGHRPLRKMGHLTALGDNPRQAGARAVRGVQRLRDDHTRFSMSA